MATCAADKRPGLLSNDDFRQLLYTPRTSSGFTDAAGPAELPSAKPAEKRQQKVTEKKAKKRRYTEAMRREDVLSQLQKKYRDRAQERRDGQNPDYVISEDRELQTVSAGAYHAVAPDAGYNRRQALRRKQLIQESKYLGGDMAHTHLVKGLDYALLNKVRKEIEVRNKERGAKEEKEEQEAEAKEQIAVTKIGKAVMDVVFSRRALEKNPLFAPGKMSYVVHLEGDEAEHEIPTIVIRSNRDIDPESHIKSLTTTDAVIEKLKTVLAHVKNGVKIRRSKKISNEDPYNEYQEEKPQKQEVKKTSKSPTAESSSLYKKTLKTKERLLQRLSSEPTSYAECYPGQVESVEATYDSDEAADYSMMDRARKSAVGRWDFDHEEDYSEYMTRREALPKAAFQYGLKKSGGRRTRKGNPEKAALDRLWGEIKTKMQQMKSGIIEPIT
ncbi:protein Red-like [Cimex lectularius]|uniref:Protein Red n=1 Tax=Cimex lectularius TaxID=79782 RepID=A0A8I6R8U1_CIMLE|nr:protein Red-like [Cimex lectularius]